MDDRAGRPLAGLPLLRDPTGAQPILLRAAPARHTAKGGTGPPARTECSCLLHYFSPPGHRFDLSLIFFEPQVRVH